MLEDVTLTCITAPEIPVAAGTEHLSNAVYAGIFVDARMSVHNAVTNACTYFMS